MATRSPITDHYTATVTINIQERNAYGDALNDNLLTFTRKLKIAGGIAELGEILAKLQSALTP